MGTFKGIVISKEKKQGTSAKGDWVSFTYVIQETGTQYPQTGVFEIFGDKIPEIDEKAEVEVDFDLKANEYQGKWYNKLQIWKYNLLSEQPKEVDKKKEKEEGDNLPF